jgi:cyclase
MISTRIIAKLDIKPPFLVKPVHFEGLRKIGFPSDLASKYYKDGIDEIFYIDIVASLFQRDIISDEVSKLAKNIFVPLTAGGGVKSIEDFSLLIKSGADKVAINTYALQSNPNIIDDAAKIFGSQAVVVNIEAKYNENNWECYTDCGRIKSGKNVLDWVKEVENRGAGEILIQSIDKDGKQKGFDINLIGEVVSNTKIPIIASSGAGSIDHIIEVIKKCKPSGIAISSILHYNKIFISDIKKEISKIIIG